MATTLAFLPGKFQGQGSLAGNSSRGRKESGIAEHAPQITILLKAKSYNFHLPLPCWNSLVAQMIKSLPAMQETRVCSPGGKICWRRKITAHSSILAWKIAWMEEPGRLQFRGSQRVGHDWATSLSSLIALLTSVQLLLSTLFWCNSLSSVVIGNIGSHYSSLNNSIEQ